MNRGLSVISTLSHLLDRELSAAEIKEAQMLGWCVEWLQAFFLVSDDLMDSSVTRRGQPCWYKLVRCLASAFFFSSVKINALLR
jgi:farnesyl diphosphate synthase